MTKSGTPNSVDPGSSMSPVSRSRLQPDGAGQIVGIEAVVTRGSSSVNTAVRGFGPV
jgi:hypothetical protein